MAEWIRGTVFLWWLNFKFTSMRIINIMQCYVMLCYVMLCYV